jgi:hypothetical protein
MLRYRLISRILHDIPATSLAENLTIKQAADTAWTIASPESYDLLVHRLGYTHPKFQEWMERNLIAVILAAGG